MWLAGQATDVGGEKIRQSFNDVVSLTNFGFGIGNSSKISWDFTYVNTFKVSDLISITAGYRTFKYTREDGEGDEKLETTVNAFGPLLGVSFVF